MSVAQHRQHFADSSECAWAVIAFGAKTELSAISIPFLKAFKNYSINQKWMAAQPLKWDAEIALLSPSEKEQLPIIAPAKGEWRFPRRVYK